MTSTRADGNPPHWTKKLVSDGFRITDVKYFLFYFKIVAEVDASGEHRLSAIIKHLRSRAFQYFLQKSTIRGELKENTKSYKVAKASLKEKFGSKREMLNFINAKASIRIIPRDGVLEFLTKIDVAYRKFGFSDDQNFAFLSMNTLLTNNTF